MFVTSKTQHCFHFVALLLSGPPHPVWQQTGLLWPHIAHTINFFFIQFLPLPPLSTFSFTRLFFFFFTNSTIKAVLDASISTSELVPTWPLILFLWSSFCSSLFHHKSSSHRPYWNLRDNNYEVPVKKDINVKLLFRMKKVKSKFCFVMVRTHIFLFVCLLVNVVHGKT